jgi:hypothetical protein
MFAFVSLMMIFLIVSPMTAEAGAEREIERQVSISPTFYARLFCTKVLRQAFLYLHFRFELFLAQEYWRKCTHKMLVKMTTAGLPLVLKLVRQ